MSDFHIVTEIFITGRRYDALFLKSHLWRGPVSLDGDIQICLGGTVWCDKWSAGRGAKGPVPCLSSSPFQLRDKPRSLSLCLDLLPYKVLMKKNTFPLHLRWLLWRSKEIMSVKTFHILDTAFFPPFPKEFHPCRWLYNLQTWINISKFAYLVVGSFLTVKALSLFGSGYLHLGSLQAFTIQYVQWKWPSF